MISCLALIHDLVCLLRLYSSDFSVVKMLLSAMHMMKVVQFLTKRTLWKCRKGEQLIVFWITAGTDQDKHDMTQGKSSEAYKTSDWLKYTIWYSIIFNFCWMHDSIIVGGRYVGRALARSRTSTPVMNLAIARSVFVWGKEMFDDSRRSEITGKLWTGDHPSDQLLSRTLTLLSAADW